MLVLLKASGGKKVNSETTKMLFFVSIGRGRVKTKMISDYG